MNMDASLRSIAFFAQVLIAALVCGCTAENATGDPRDTLLAANDRINKLVESERAVQQPPPPRPPLPLHSDSPLRFWYYAHPLIAEHFDGAPLAIAGTTVQPQFMGEWPVAVQKWMASFAADDLPDVGMVKRDLVARLYNAGRIRPLDSVLPRSLVDDLRPEVLADYTYDGHLIALPADGFCSLLYFNRRSVGAEPPKNWAFLAAYLNAHRATPSPPPPRGMGAFPFLEALWSADGDVLKNGVGALHCPEAQRALEFSIEVTRGSLVSEARAFREWTAGELAMTIASSRNLPAAAASDVDFGIAPVPGETGPISRRSNDAVVVFSRGSGASEESIAAFLDWLTGSQVMGEAALTAGSVPLRKSLLEFESRVPEIAAAYAAGRNSPLHPNWGAIEAELQIEVARAYRKPDQSS